MSKATATVKKAAQADRALTHAAAAHRHHPVARAAGAVAEVADQPPLVTLSALTAAAGLVAGRRDLVRGGLRMLAAHGVATGIKTLIKRRVDRTRPKKALDDGKHRFQRGDSRDHELSSFPSGHLAGAVAVSRAAAREIDGIGPASAIGVGMVAAAQAPAGNHYLSDMVAGAVIGWVSEAAVAAAVDAADPLIGKAMSRIMPQQRWAGS